MAWHRMEEWKLSEIEDTGILSSISLQPRWHKQLEEKTSDRTIITVSTHSTGILKICQFVLKKFEDTRCPLDFVECSSLSYVTLASHTRKERDKDYLSHKQFCAPPKFFVVMSSHFFPSCFLKFGNLSNKKNLPSHKFSFSGIPRLFPGVTWLSGPLRSFEAPLDIKTKGMNG